MSASGRKLPSGRPKRRLQGYQQLPAGSGHTKAPPSRRGLIEDYCRLIVPSTTPSMRSTAVGFISAI